MKTILNILLLTSLFCSCNQTKSRQDEKQEMAKSEYSTQSPLKKDFREIRWGMTYDQVGATEMMLETNKYLTSERILHYTTQIFAFGDKCYLEYGFQDNKLYYLELEYDMPDEFDNNVVADGESFSNAFSRSRKIMKNIQFFSYFQFFFNVPIGRS